MFIAFPQQQWLREHALMRSFISTIITVYIIITLTLFLPSISLPNFAFLSYKDS